MDVSRNELLSEIATDAALERREFLAEATEQLRRFLAANGERIREAGGLVLIDEDPDYLSVAPDGSFRSRTRFQDEETSEWISETEVIDSVSELVELYNPADVYSAFSEAARAAAGLSEEPTAAGDLMEVAGIAPDEMVADLGYAEAADAWAASNEEVEAPEDTEEAARLLYDLALTYQERSQDTEAKLLDQFEIAARALAARVGDLIVVDDEDERLTFTGAGRFVAEVVPDDEKGEWRKLDSGGELVEYYDPTDVFGDLADALAEAYPGVAPDEDDEDDEDGDDDEDDEEDGDDEPGGGDGKGADEPGGTSTSRGLIH
jgi:hypothetical protein